MVVCSSLIISRLGLLVDDELNDFDKEVERRELD